MPGSYKIEAASSRKTEPSIGTLDSKLDQVLAAVKGGPSGEPGPRPVATFVPEPEPVTPNEPPVTPNEPPVTPVPVVSAKPSYRFPGTR